MTGEWRKQIGKPLNYRGHVTSTIERAMQRHPGGRPRFGKEAMRKRNVTLSDEDVERAKQIGDGNVSRGIRIALASMMHRDTIR